MAKHRVVENLEHYADRQHKAGNDAAARRAQDKANEIKSRENRQAKR